MLSLCQAYFKERILIMSDNTPNRAQENSDKPASGLEASVHGRFTISERTLMGLMTLILSMSSFGGGYIYGIHSAVSMPAIHHHGQKYLSPN